MDDVVGVCFKPTGKVYYFSCKGLGLDKGTKVVAETTKGRELAEVVCLGPQCGGSTAKGKLKPLLRVATEDDIRRGQDNHQRADEARRVCHRLLAQLELPVKLVDAEYAFDARRITFSFASEEKTDLCDLRVRLREIYDCEVELRQIGVRDQAKLLGGLGSCGRQLCCASFLRGFQPVTIKMAKDQNMSLNPNKISGQCGRLMCCLRYEHEAYAEARKTMPKVGSTVQTPEGPGRAVDVNLLLRRVRVETEAGTVQVHLDEVGEAQLEPRQEAKSETRPPKTETRRREAKSETRPPKTETRRRDAKSETRPPTTETRRRDTKSETRPPKTETRRRDAWRRPARERTRPEPVPALEVEPKPAEATEPEKKADPADSQAPQKRRRRPRRRPRRRGPAKTVEAGGSSSPRPAEKAAETAGKTREAAERKPAGEQPGPKKRRPRRRSSRRRGRSSGGSAGAGGQKQ